MADQRDMPDVPQPRPSGERRLAIAGAALFGFMLVAGLALWVRHGEEIFFSRIVSAIQSCF